MGEYVNNNVISATSDDIGMLKSEISTLQYKVRRMSTADSRNKQNSKLWKPEVTPPRRRGGSFRGRSDRQNDSGRQKNLVQTTAQMVTVVKGEISMVEISQGTAATMVSHLALKPK